MTYDENKPNHIYVVDIPHSILYKQRE